MSDRLGESFKLERRAGPRPSASSLSMLDAAPVPVERKGFFD